MEKLAVIYWSQTGNTQAMAEAVLEGARAGGADAQIFAVSEITADQAAEYPRLALGCPAMGAEVLEEAEFEPFFTELEPKLSGKRVALFGSYGWGGGDWMREWEKRMAERGAKIVGGEGVIALESPDGDAEKQLKNLGEALA